MSLKPGARMVLRRYNLYQNKSRLIHISSFHQQVLLHVQEEDKKAVCPVYHKPDYFGMIIGIAGGIVGVGMLTILMWKAFTTVTDRREFARLSIKASVNILHQHLSGLRQSVR